MANFSEKLLRLLANADRQIAAQVAENQKWGISEFEHWGLDQDAGLITFTDECGAGICAPAQIIGHRRLDDGSWLWSWANPSFGNQLTAAARNLMEYGKINGFSELCEPRLADITEDDAWQISALAAQLQELSGTYRGPYNNLHIYIAYGQIEDYRIG